MRHGKKFNHLSRKSAHRKAMLANMACSLIEHKRITTTLAKAKALRVFLEPLITKSKNDTTHSRRIVFSYLRQKNAITELFNNVSVKIADRPGGYIRILKLGNRLGDNAQMAYVELVDFNEEYITDRPKRKKARRTRKKKGEKTVNSETKSIKKEDTSLNEVDLNKDMNKKEDSSENTQSMQESSATNTGSSKDENVKKTSSLDNDESNKNKETQNKTKDEVEKIINKEKDESSENEDVKSSEKEKNVNSKNIDKKGE